MKLKKMLKMVADGEPINIRVADKYGVIIDEMQVDDVSKLSKDLLSKKVSSVYSMFDSGRYIKTLDNFNCTHTVIEVD